MFRFIVRRLLQAIPTLLGISIVVFLMVHLAPGDPVLIMLGSQEQAVTPERIAELREAWGFNDPLYVQYWRFLKDALRGDLGRSIYTGQDVFQSIAQRIPATLLLTVSSLIVAVAVSVPIGIISATRQYSAWDYIGMVGALLGVSMPTFWFALLAMFLFSLKLGWLPATGMGHLANGIGDVIKHLIMPSLTLGFGMAAMTTRLTRSSMLDVIRQDYIRTAKAKGLSERVVIYRHALKNALIPIVTVIGTQFGSLLGGAVVTETIFAWPGMGRQAVASITRRDLPMIQGNVLFMCLIFVLVNLLVDISYSWLDPRIRYD
ncbi:MAG TPA: ABC transporter permease [Firmicutes bacterium]|nr:ABC transporter permease [Candidatus Fermentithermobacillaceae bacterium]